MLPVRVGLATGALAPIDYYGIEWMPGGFIALSSGWVIAPGGTAANTFTLWSGDDLWSGLALGVVLIFLSFAFFNLTASKPGHSKK